MTPEDIERMNTFVETTHYDEEPSPEAVEAAGQDSDDEPPAAGVLYCIPGSKFLMCLRSDGEGWSFPAGHLEEGEQPHEAARREFLEEVGHDCGDLTDAPCVSFVNHKGTPFTCFYVDGEQFMPKLEAEHTAFCWAGHDFIPTPVHPGVPGIFTAFDKMFGTADCNCN